MGRTQRCWVWSYYFITKTPSSAHSPAAQKALSLPDGRQAPRAHSLSLLTHWVPIPCSLMASGGLDLQLKTGPSRKPLPSSLWRVSPLGLEKRKNLISKVPSQQEEIVIGSSFSFLSRFWWGGGGGQCLVFIEFITILLLLFWFFGHETCGGLSSLTTDGTHAPCIERQSLKHEVPLGLHFQCGVENV